MNAIIRRQKMMDLRAENERLRQERNAMITTNAELLARMEGMYEASYCEACGCRLVSVGAGAQHCPNCDRIALLEQRIGHYRAILYEVTYQAPLDQSYERWARQLTMNALAENW